MSVEVRMVQQMSGSRAPGTDWPAPGETMMVTKEEAELLCHTDSQHPVPIAVKVRDWDVTTGRAEVADRPDERVETRPGPTEDAVREENLPAEMRHASPPPPEQPVKRGPGRPPGSTNRPK